MRPVRLCILAVGGLSLISAACSSFPWIITGSALLSQAPTPTPRASQFPRGRFSAVSTPDMITLSIENDGDFRLYIDSALLDSGSFDIAGPQVVVDSMLCAKEGSRPAQYDWVYDAEDRLVFQPVIPDACPERRQYLSEVYTPKYVFVFNVPDRGVSKDWLW